MELCVYHSTYAELSTAHRSIECVYHRHRNLTCYPGTAIIQPYTPGNGYTPGFGGSSNPAPAPTPSPAPYVAKAVHFDGSTYLLNPNLNTTDGHFFSISLWFKIASLPNTNTTQTIFVTDPQGNYTNEAWFAGSGFHAPKDHFVLQLYSASGNGSDGIIENFSSTTSADSSWHHLLASGRSDTGSTKIYIDDIDVTGAGYNTSVVPFIQSYNGLALAVFGDTDSNNILGDVADVWIAPGQNLLDSNGDISTSTRREFISDSGKPVDLGADCSAPTGTAPAVCLSGDASTFGTNKGTGGSFTLTGTLTNADTSPSN